MNINEIKLEMCEVKSLSEKEVAVYDAKGSLVGIYPYHDQAKRVAAEMDKKYAATFKRRLTIARKQAA